MITLPEVKAKVKLNLFLTFLIKSWILSIIWVFVHIRVRLQGLLLATLWHQRLGSYPRHFDSLSLTKHCGCSSPTTADALSLTSGRMRPDSGFGRRTLVSPNPLTRLFVWSKSNTVYTLKRSPLHHTRRLAVSSCLCPRTFQ